MEVTCPRCGRTWQYKGAKRSTKEIPKYTSCCDCRANVKLPVTEAMA